MKPFKFLQGKKKISNRYILPYRRTESLNRQDTINQGWRANANDLPPALCPYGIGTPQREWWMLGWSDRENFVRSEQ